MDEIKIVLQLASKVLVLRSSSNALAADKIPWQLCWPLLIEVLRLSIQSGTPYKEWCFKLSLAPDVDLSDALPEAVNLLVVLTSSTICTAPSCDGIEAKKVPYLGWLLPFLMSCLETYPAKPWSGVIVVLLAVLSSRLDHNMRQVFINRPGFSDNIQAGQ